LDDFRLSVSRADADADADADDSADRFKRDPTG
jgi:hypothetical protein